MPNTNPQTLLELNPWMNREEDMPTHADCIECHGSGRDFGDRTVGYGESDCEECSGTGRVKRDFLAEALRIVAFDQYAQVRREHLIALAVHARELIEETKLAPRIPAKPAGGVGNSAVKKEVA